MDNLFTKTKKRLHITTYILLLFITIFILIIILFKYSNVCSKINQSINQKINSKSIEKINIEVEEVKDISWYISIPKINMEKIEIKEGVDDNTLSTSIGHFEDTDIYNGNVCLAAHNRGCTVNYFENIHKLENGDIICYNSKEGYREYEVYSKEIIDVYDFSCTKRVEGKNVITLITCVENNPNERLCVRGIERSIYN